MEYHELYFFETQNNVIHFMPHMESTNGNSTLYLYHHDHVTIFVVNFSLLYVVTALLFFCSYISVMSCGHDWYDLRSIQECFECLIDLGFGIFNRFISDNFDLDQYFVIRIMDGDSVESIRSRMFILAK